MIVQLEIEQFIKEIDSRVSSLQGEAQQKALDKSRMLRMVLKEIRDLHDECWMWSVKWANAETTTGRTICENLRLKETILMLEDDLAKLKQNIPL